MGTVSFESLSPGMEFSVVRKITDEMVKRFSDISGDYNPVHLNDEYASKTRFKRRIAHGLISAGFFSSIFGTEVPGEGCVYVSQTLRFKRPVYIDDTVEAKVVITSVDKKSRRVFFDTFCFVDGKKVIDGAAEIFVP